MNSNVPSSGETPTPGSPVPQLRLLFLEDTPHDAEIAAHELRRAGFRFESRCVQTESEFRNALREFSPQLILADFNLPSFSGLVASSIAQTEAPDVPFVFLSGAIGEEQAVSLLKAGATDCVLKHRISALGPAVKRALREAEQRAEARRAEQALREQERFSKAVLNSLHAFLAVLDKDGVVVAVNAAWEKFAHEHPNTSFARSRVGVNYLEVAAHPASGLHEADRDVADGMRAVLNRSRTEFTLEYFCQAAGGSRWFLLYVTPLFTEQGGAVVAHVDITERKRAEQERRELEARLRRAERLASIGELAASIARDLNTPSLLRESPTAAGRDVPGDLQRLLQHYEALLEAAKSSAAGPTLIAQAEAARAQVNEQVVLNLCRLLVALSDFHLESEPRVPSGAEPGADTQHELFQALQETIDVLIQTRRSFKSKTLGNLRQKLEKLVERGI